MEVHLKLNSVLLIVKNWITSEGGAQMKISGGEGVKRYRNSSSTCSAKGRVDGAWCSSPYPQVQQLPCLHDKQVLAPTQILYSSNRRLRFPQVFHRNWVQLLRGGGCRIVTYQALVTLWFLQMKPKMDKQGIAPSTFLLTYLLAHDTRAGNFRMDKL